MQVLWKGILRPKKKIKMAEKSIRWYKIWLIDINNTYYVKFWRYTKKTEAIRRSASWEKGIHSYGKYKGWEVDFVSFASKCDIKDKEKRLKITNEAYWTGIIKI